MVHSYPQRDILPSGSAASDWCNQPKALQSFWPYPGNAKGIAEAIAARGAIDLARRERTANCIRRQYAEVGIAPPEGLTAFAQGAEVVTVGHQLQAGGGPAFFHYKILSALRWAAQLRATGTPAIAVFWMASEDHDFEEISRTHAPDGASFEWTPERMEQAPVGRIKWDAQAEQAWQAWCQATLQSTGAVQHQSMPLAHRVRHWLNEWFGDEDLVIIDGDDTDLKASAYPIFAEEWNGDGVAPALQTARAEYEAKWSSAPLQVRDNNLFVLEANGLRTRADRWLDAHGADAAQNLRPEQLSPNASLRPLYQEFVLQSAAFVGGPSEVGYWLMLGEAFRRHQIPHPALVVRDGAFVHDHRSLKAADACGWTPQQPALTGDAAVATWADKQLRGNGELDLAFEAWSKALIAHAEGVPGDAVPTTRAALTKMEKELVHVQKKWRKMLRQQHAEEAEAIRSAFEDWSCPKGKGQERHLSALPLMEAAGGREVFVKMWYKALEGANEPQFLVFHPAS